MGSHPRASRDTAPPPFSVCLNAAVTFSGGELITLAIENRRI